MAYKCVHCGKIYEDSSLQVLQGCDECGRKFFFYMKKEQLEKIKTHALTDVQLSNAEKKQIEEDVREITGLENEDIPVFLDFESVVVTRPGKYAIDLKNLFSVGKPRVYRLEDGKYIIDFYSKNSYSKESI